MSVLPYLMLGVALVAAVLAILLIRGGSNKEPETDQEKLDDELREYVRMVNAGEDV